MKFGFLLLVAGLGSSLSGQNLVPNPGFEDLTSCPEAAGSITNAPPWMNPNLKSPDLYHRCTGAACESLPFVCVPDNWMGSQEPASGSGYAGILVGAGNENREYIQVSLLENLSAGQAYELTYYLSLADDYQHAIDRMGVYFSPTEVFADGALNYVPQLTSAPGNFFADKSGWTLVRDTLIAAGGEAFMVIGNFFDEDETRFTDGHGGGRSSSYYYIDDVKLLSVLPEEDPSENDCPDPFDPQCEEETDTPVTDGEEANCPIYFPNVFSPNRDGVNDEIRPFTECVPEAYRLVIFNRWGARVFETADPERAWDGRSGGSEMTSGVYLFQLRLSFNGGMEVRRSGAFTLLR